MVATSLITDLAVNLCLWIKPSSQILLERYCPEYLSPSTRNHWPSAWLPNRCGCSKRNPQENLPPSDVCRPHMSHLLACRMLARQIVPVLPDVNLKNCSPHNVCASVPRRHRLLQSPSRKPSVKYQRLQIHHVKRVLRLCSRQLIMQGDFQVKRHHQALQPSRPAANLLMHLVD